MGVLMLQRGTVNNNTITQTIAFALLIINKRGLAAGQWLQILPLLPY
jgi:hypothetical protein